MSYLNSATIIGFVGADPEQRVAFVSSPIAVATGVILTRLSTKLRTRRAGVNCFAAAMLFEMRRLLFRDTYLFADKPDRNAKAYHIGSTAARQ